MKRKFFKYFIGIFAVAMIAAVVMDKIQKSNTPTFLLEKFEELKNNRSLMNSIGGYDRFEYSYQVFYNENYDSLNYGIMIFGKNKKLSYTSVGIRKSGSDEVISNEGIEFLEY
jgi:hypothetical protein